MSNVIPNDAATTTHGPTGRHALPHVAPVIKSVLSPIVIVYRFKLIVNVVPIRLLFLNGLNGVPVVPNVEMVS